MAESLSPNDTLKDEDDDSQYMHDAGQYEPLTTRLKNILSEYQYRNGITIIKELLQNAEDAGATELNILFDARTHPSDQLRLLGMAKTHGPALIVHNDAEFSDKDFENITKLAGGTKKDDPLKIGKFGVGFCSVYHLTDVPSFVSGKWLYIFDPTFDHLEDVIHNRNQPGKKIEFARMFKTGAQQMAPYEGLCNFKTSEKYSGSMFRLPFRNTPSNISTKTYTSENLNQIIGDLQKCLKEESTNLLLFLRNVKKVTFQLIPENYSEPKMHTIICREPDKIYSEISTFKVINCDSAEADADCMEKWVISNVLDEHISNVAETQEPKIGIASVAVRLLHHENSYECGSVDGEAFCFLPLDIITGLPVHVSANFSVMSNRSGIWINKPNKSALNEKTQHQNSKENWTNILMESFIVKAYINLLLLLKELSRQGYLLSYSFDHLFPLKVNTSWEPFMKSFYNAILSVPLFQSCSSVCYWLNSAFDAKFVIKDELLTWGGTAVLEALPLLAVPTLGVCNLVMTSSEIFHHLIAAAKHHNKKRYKRKSKHKAVSQLTEVEFIQMFFNHIDSFEDNTKLRNDVLYKIFNFVIRLSMTHTNNNNPIYLYRQFLRDLLKTKKCIPCQPNGKILKKPSELINPSSPYFKMLLDEFKDFTTALPIDEFIEPDHMCEFMKLIGLQHETIPLNTIIDCAKSIEICESSFNKILCILKCIFSTPVVDLSAEFTNALQNIVFIPVLPKPQNYEGKWRAQEDDCQWTTLSEVFISVFKSQNDHVLLGSQKYFVNLDLVSIQLEEQKRNSTSYYHSMSALEIDHRNRCESLGIQCIPSVDDVLRQFESILDCVADNPEMSESFISQSMSDIYSFFNEKLKSNRFYIDEEELQTVFMSRKSIYIGGKVFVSPQDIARNWHYSLGPFLYQLPENLIPLKALTTTLNIEDFFSMEKLVKTLEKIYVSAGCIEYSKVAEQIVNDMNRQFNSHSTTFDVSNIDMSRVFLPDNDKKLHPVHRLVINNHDWLPIHEDLVEVSKNLNPEIALAFGVKQWCKDLYCEKFTKCNIDIKGYGQRVELTRSIYNILQDCCLNATLLHEFLQNADDAKASKMYVMLDKRNHKCEKVPTDGWEKLQGPSLLIWNDGIFEDKDIEDLQCLGLSSKRFDQKTIGQYGIGFCVVYHVTDCPSFVVKERDTLCVLDPHYSYIRGTTSDIRGRQMSNLLAEDSFWDSMSDMASAYLQTENDLQEFKDGVLFRLPLRQEEIEYKDTTKLGDKITASDIENKLESWVPSIKEALLFLPHVREFRYYVIDEDGSYNKKAEYNMCVVDPQSPCTTSMDALHKIRIKAVEKFKLKMKNSFEEEWLIQECTKKIDCQKSDTEIQTIPCGIAAPLKLGCTFQGGNLFNFLPLPINSHLPVHLNTKFDLSTNRRSLMPSKRNKSLFEELSHLYVKFLEQAREIMVLQKYSNLKTFYSDIDAYFNLYPFLQEDFDLGDEEFTLRDFMTSFFKFLWQKDALIMPSSAQHSGTETEEILVHWHNLRSSFEGEQIQKVFFKDTNDHESSDIPVDALREIGIVLSDAPLSLYSHLIKSDVNHKPLKVSPLNAFEFFRDNYTKIFDDKFPCSIVKTPCTVKTFVEFIMYILQQPKGTPYCSFVKSPFNYPLLLTADEKIRKFHREEKVLQSKYSFIFPESTELFLHPKFPTMDPLYFMTKKEVTLKFEKCAVFEKNFNSNTLRKAAVNNDKEGLILNKKLEEIWECFSSGELFENKYINEILNQWAFIPAKNGHLYSFLSEIRPLIPVKDEIFNCLSKYLPVMDTRFFKYPMIKQFGLDVSRDGEFILVALCACAKLNDIFVSLKQNKFDLDLIAKYLRTSRINYQKKQTLLVKLPIFKIITNEAQELEDLVDLENKKVIYLWPGDNDICRAGMKHWLPDRKRVVFLHPDSDWYDVCEFARIAKAIDPKEIFTKYILPKFDKLNDDERKDQLQFAKNLFEYALLDVRCSKKNSTSDIARSFIDSLKKLCCFRDEENPLDHKLYPIRSFCDHTQPIFSSRIIPSQFKLVPSEYSGSSKDNEEWLTFFYHLELQTEPLFHEFERLCLSIQESRPKISQQELSSNADILLQYLFSKNGRQWLRDRNKASRISKIPFIIPIQSGLPFEIQGLRHFEIKPLVSFSESAIHDDHKLLLWTVYPLIKLKKPSDIDEKQFLSHLEKLNVKTSPELPDVFANVENIAVSSLSRYGLFHKYDINYTDDAGKLINDTIFESLKFIQHSRTNEGYLKKLSNVSCLPVPVNGTRSKIVLVPPVQMVQRMTDEEKTCFNPYINVPSFTDSINYVLFSIDVADKIGLKHMEMILTMIYKHSKDSPRLDPNQVLTVRNAILKLGKILKVNQYVHETSSLVDDRSKSQPLYLPCDTGQGWKLENSTEMYYPDLIRYSQIDCSPAELCIFKIPPQSQDHKAVASAIDRRNVPNFGVSYFAEITEIEVCREIEKDRRPKKLSAHCKEVFDDEKEHEIKASTNPLFLQIHRYFRHKYYHQLILILPKIIRSHLPNMSTNKVDEFTKEVHQLIRKMKMIVIENLTVQVFSLENNVWISKVQPKLYLKSCDPSKRYKLYISKHATGRPSDLLEAAEVVCLEVLKQLKAVYLDERTITSLTLSLQECFKVSSLHQVKILCEKYNISWEELELKGNSSGSLGLQEDDENFIEYVKPQLGVCIPEVVCDLYLDRDDRNHYRPQEWIGYETEEEIFVWAIALYQNDDDSYTIMVNLKDHKTITEIAPVAKLCKFVTDIDDEGELPVGSEYSSLLISKKLEISEQLTELRSIQLKDESEEIAENIARRLYIKYHPETVKNSKKKLFEELHKYLLNEGGFAAHWKHMFHQWNMHLYRIGRNRSKAKRSSRKVKWLPPDDVDGDTSISTKPTLDAHVSNSKTQDNKQYNLQPVPSPDEAKRWLKQAKADYMEMTLCQTSRPCHKLFLSHEVIEKSLKAAVYQLVGLNPRFLKHHDITSHANAIYTVLKKQRINVLKEVSLLEIAKQVEEEEYYVKSRFPNQIEEGRAPVDVFSQEKAEEISKKAGSVFNFVENNLDKWKPTKSV